MSFSSRITEDYQRRAGVPRDLALDAHYGYQWAVLRDMLSRLEVILDDEGIDREKAERILRCLLYGSPSPADAELRIATDERVKEAFKREPPVIHVDGIHPDVLAKLGLPPI